MPELPAIASSPIAFSKDGTYFQVPLSAVYFDSSGVLKADRWPQYVTHQAIVDRLLDQMKTSGVLVAGTEPYPKPGPAFTVTAKTPGATGVGVAIDVATVTANAPNPPASTAKVKVTETDTYTSLELAKLVETIGNAANGGKRPGLVFVSSAAAPELPKNGAYPVTAPATAGDPATVDIPKNSGSGNAFTLQTRSGTADALAVSVEIKDANPATSTFTLIVTWTKTQNTVAMSGLGAAFTYAVDVTAPPGGFLAPKEGVTTLSGGADAVSVPAVKSSAVILSK